MQGIGTSETDVRALRFVGKTSSPDEVGVQNKASTSKQKADFSLHKFVYLAHIMLWKTCPQITTSFTRIFLHGQIFAR
jgi:hypothetical protein